MTKSTLSVLGSEFVDIDFCFIVEPLVATTHTITIRVDRSYAGLLYIRVVVYNVMRTCH